MFINYCISITTFKCNFESTGPSKVLLVLHHLTAFFQNNLGKPAPERKTILDFTRARDDVVAVASAGPHANHLHLTPDR